MSSKVIEFKQKQAALKLTISEAQRKINELAKISANIGYTKHAMERMLERGFITRDVERILKTGIIRKEPRQDTFGCWPYKIEERGARDAAVIVVLYDPKLTIITVEWMD